MGKKILLADDSITIQKVIELTFSDEDFEVVTVGNGRLAIERVQDVRPDIVLCDIIMPEKDGYEVCEFIKKQPALSHTPVLLLTGAFEPFDQERAVRVGSDGYLAKPFEPQTLIAKVKELLSQAASRAASRPAPTAAPAPAAPTPPPAPVAAPPQPAAFTAPAMPFVAATPAPAPVAAPSWSVNTPVPTPAAAPAPAPVPVAAASAPAPVPAATAPAPAPMWEPEPMEVPSWTSEPAPAEVSFISDEPFTNTPVPISEEPEDMPYLAAGSPTLDEDLYVPEPMTPMDELMDVAPEEAASLSSASPVPMSSTESEDLVSAGTWTDPTVEVSLEDRAQAGIAAQAENEAVFEEVFDHDTHKAPSRIEPASADVFSRFAPELSAESHSMAEPVPVPVSAPSPLPKPPLPTTTPLPEPIAPPLERLAAPAPSPVAELAPPPPSVLPEPQPEPEPEPVAELEPPAIEEELSFSDLSPADLEPEPPTIPPSAAAAVPVPVDMVSQIAQRVIAQISDKVVREVAWEVIPELAETLIKKEIERLKAELAKI